MTLAQDFREARDWFFQHKRDPFLWLVILGRCLRASGEQRLGGTRVFLYACILLRNRHLPFRDPTLIVMKEGPGK